MTSKAVETIVCPKCRFRQDTELYETINAVEDPELVDRLFAREINVFTCVRCGHKAKVEAPLLFSDLKTEVKIQYFPAIWLDENPAGFCQHYREMKAQLKAFQADFGFMAKSIREQEIRVVFSMEEMIAQIKFKRHPRERSQARS
ncbi:CpXC domain-containing protein [Desulfosarcina widdelii]|nr:CpXC domain-containing protein [Desulfosarcina widdelii]